MTIVALFAGLITLTWVVPPDEELTSVLLERTASFGQRVTCHLSTEPEWSNALQPDNELFTFRAAACFEPVCSDCTNYSNPVTLFCWPLVSELTSEPVTGRLRVHGANFGPPPLTVTIDDEAVDVVAYDHTLLVLDSFLLPTDPMVIKITNPSGYNVTKTVVAGEPGHPNLQNLRPWVDLQENP